MIPPRQQFPAIAFLGDDTAGTDETRIYLARRSGATRRETWYADLENRTAGGRSQAGLLPIWLEIQDGGSPYPVVWRNGTAASAADQLFAAHHDFGDGIEDYDGFQRLPVEVAFLLGWASGLRVRFRARKGAGEPDMQLGINLHRIPDTNTDSILSGNVTITTTALATYTCTLT